MKNNVFIIAIMLLISNILLAQQKPQTLPQVRPLPIVKTGYLRLPMLKNISKVSYIVRDGLAIMEGDIVLGEAAEVEALSIQNEVAYRQQGGKRDSLVPMSVVLPEGIWYSSLIPYEIKSKDFDAQAIRTIQAGIDLLNQKTNVELKLRTTEKDYIEFVRTNNPDIGGQSPIGRQGGKQRIHLNPTSLSSGTVAHEIMHSLGFYHEHTRSDRDRFVDIKWNNIEERYKHNFFKQEASYTFGVYDVNSLMHYDGFSFATDTKKPTIVVRSTGQPAIAQRSNLSTGDVEGINAVYKSLDSRPPTTGSTLPSLNTLRSISTKIISLETIAGPNEAGACNKLMDYRAEIIQGPGREDLMHFSKSMERIFGVEEGNFIQPNWEAHVPLDAGKRFARITIQVFDKDHLVCGNKEDVIDVSPAPGVGGLWLWADTTTGDIWELSPVMPLTPFPSEKFQHLGRVGQSLTVKGNAQNDHAAKITFVVNLQ